MTHDLLIRIIESDFLKKLLMVTSTLSWVLRPHELAHSQKNVAFFAFIGFFQNLHMKLYKSFITVMFLLIPTRLKMFDKILFFIFRTIFTTVHDFLNYLNILRWVMDWKLFKVINFLRNFLNKIKKILATINIATFSFWYTW